MKAIVVHQYGPPEVLRFEEYPDPARGPGQVLVRVAAATRPDSVPVQTDWEMSYMVAGLPFAPQVPYAPHPVDVLSLGQSQRLALRFYQVCRDRRAFKQIFARSSRSGILTP